MTLELPPGFFHCQQCRETFLGEECPSCERGGLATHWVLTSDGWRQPRLDGTVWMLDPRDSSAVVPDPDSTPASDSHLHKCDDELTFRIAAGTNCEICGGAESDATGGEKVDAELRAEEFDEVRTLPAPAGKLRSAINKGVWIVAVTTAALLGLAIVNAEYGLGIFEESDGAVAAAPAETTTTTSAPVSTTARSTTSTSRSTTSTSSSIAEPVDWLQGSCVAFDGDLAEPVSCNDSYDAVILELVDDEVDCPMATDWYVELDSAVACVDEEKRATEDSFPPGRVSLEHGRSTWVVILASASSIDAPNLEEAVEAAAEAGYVTGATDCDLGATEALGVSSSHFTVSVYLRSESDARRAQAAFASQGIDGTVALVETYCLD